MAEADMPAAAQEPEWFPPFNFPVLFSDGVLSLTRGGAFVKYYHFRTDPSVRALGTTNAVANAQIAMPTNAFIQMVGFFNRQIEVMIEKSEVTRENVEALQKAIIGEVPEVAAVPAENES